MKKVLTFLLTLALALSLVACGSSGGQSQAGAQTDRGQQGESQGGAAGRPEDTLTVAFCQYANLNNWRVTQTNDMEATLAFYQSLGFTLAHQADNDGERVCFLQLAGVCIEAYENGRAVGRAGAIDHIALDVDDIEAAWEAVRAAGIGRAHV